MAFQPKIIRNPGFSPINPVNCGEEICASGHFYGPAERSHLLLHFVVSGTGEFQSPRGHFYPGPGDVFVIRPGEITRYQASTQDPWHYIWLGFQCQLPLPPVLNRDVVHLPGLQTLFRSCIDQPDITKGAQNYETWLTGTIYHLLAQLSEAQSPEDPARERYVLPAVALMEAEFAGGLSVEQVAHRLHLERSYFTKIFKATMGISPGAYLHRLRLHRSARLLEAGASVTVAAASVGYSDVFSFSRAFKSFFGSSPKSFREKT